MRCYEKHAKECKENRVVRIFGHILIPFASWSPKVFHSIFGTQPYTSPLTVVVGKPIDVVKNKVSWLASNPKT